MSWLSAACRVLVLFVLVLFVLVLFVLVLLALVPLMYVRLPRHPRTSSRPG
ncbi:DNA polymerase [Streptomyces laurentii]|uniref:DNA polymerase n=1 Tax=Streptomyces laurentii TaxID=39478 RepID=A0A160P0P8_STRLU|nr:DNA polymerase [Streptomyces laurentii]